MQSPDNLDPDIRRFIESVQAGWARHPPLASVGMAQARAIAERVRAPWAAGGPVMAQVDDIAVPHGGGTVRVRLHTPASAAATGPVLAYLHGGGWTLFSIVTHDRLMREYADRTGFRVAGIDYSLSPEARFPCALDETAAVIDWLRDQGEWLGIAPGRIAVGGDSAGANLALSAAIDRRDAGEAGLIKALLLNYGAYDDRCDRPSHHRYDGAPYMLGSDEMRGFWRNYLGGGDPAPARAAPIRAALGALPPSFLCVAECDVLRDENLDMARRLEEAGTRVQCAVHPGASHSFLEAISTSALAERAVDQAARWLRQTLEGHLSSPAGGAPA
ncbi:alpha/beta hydrolase [Sphingopyxis sp.]|uniref:alpha/beta hydrolase n=1 Tax=Sphingopyxis sp. TaxID=1908224 RepID=UPI002613D5F3|nr:alpha/beta hydrolase [Sphingopyxis sp.]MCW0197752.1 alpha/beta hydrolase [Sphingopyxis sp.]